ncbi:MAG: VanZ family protein [Lachnospiraceae bacterium]|nr:VanZ family protein [Lachnospiraceae bacterium]
MIEITYYEMLLAITVIWIALRAAVCIKNKSFEWKRELRLLLFYICIIVIARFVYFPLHRIDGQIGTLIFDPKRIIPPWLNLDPFTFIHQRYDGWQINIIGNVTMFIPVGIILPVCFKKLDNVAKVTLAGFGMSLFIELSQFLFYDRGTDVDDLILNTAGVLIGAVLYFIFRRIKNPKDRA